MPGSVQIQIHADGLSTFQINTLPSPYPTFLHPFATTGNIIRSATDEWKGAKRYGQAGAMNEGLEDTEVKNDVIFSDFSFTYAVYKVTYKTFQTWWSSPMCESVVYDICVSGREPKQPKGVSGLCPSLCLFLSISVLLLSLHSTPAAPQGVSRRNISPGTDVLSCRLLALHKARMRPSCSITSSRKNLIKTQLFPAQQWFLFFPLRE